jgi:S-adenosyl-L-methionine hydrolase (adenosine-forming)
MNVLTFLSDFGIKNSYVAQMKGVALSIASQVKCYDICHQVPAHDIESGAFLLRSAVDFYPKGTVHVAVVDPGVGTSRKGIVVLTQKHIFVGPDNGLLIPAARSQGSFRVFEITNPRLQRIQLSKTFHGRDIFTPVASHIINGISFDTIGPQIQDFVDLQFPVAIKNEAGFEAKVLYVDDFGNIITNIEHQQIKDMISTGAQLLLRSGAKETPIKLVDSYGFVEKGELLATVGSSGFLEISVNQGNASILLKKERKDTITLDFIDISKDDHVL